MNELNEIDSSFSTLNENNFIDLILHGNNKFDDKKIDMHHKIHQSFSKIWREPALIFFGIYVKRMRVSLIIELEPRPSLKKAVFLVKSYKFEVVITSLTEMLELPDVGHMNASTL